MTRPEKLGLILLSALAAASIAARARPSRPPAAPTINREIVRIFQQNCQTCHHPGDIAPFSLMTYEDASPRAHLIKFMTETGQMPPWKAAEGCGDFRGVRKLAQSDIDLIAKWANSGAPEGSPADLPAPLVFDEGWALGAPDLVLGTPAFNVPGDREEYRCFSIPSTLTETRFVAAVDIQPGNREILHHMLAFIDQAGESERLDAADPEPGYQCFGGPGFVPTGMLSGWAPGNRAEFLDPGIAIRLPAGSRLVVQLHFHPHDGVGGVDQTDLGIYFARQPVAKELRVLPMANQDFLIPAGASDHRVTASVQIPQFASLHALNITPHMHLLGRRMKVDAVRPDGTTACLVDVDDWDFRWQGTYHFQEPVALPGGTFLTLEAHYDNSAANPDNPNSPPRDVRWGEATTDEMCLAFIGFTLDSENLLSSHDLD